MKDEEEEFDAWLRLADEQLLEDIGKDRDTEAYLAELKGNIFRELMLKTESLTDHYFFCGTDMPLDTCHRLEEHKKYAAQVYARCLALLTEEMHTATDHIPYTTTLQAYAAPSQIISRLKNPYDISVRATSPSSSGTKHWINKRYTDRVEGERTRFEWFQLGDEGWKLHGRDIDST